MRPDPCAATRDLAQRAPTRDRAPADPLDGSLVGGRYRLGAPIGRGGMGVVFEAEHVSTGRRVALKVLGPQWALHREARGRFVAEARATNRIDHPDVVGVLDAGETADGRPFIAMEFLDGESLLAEVRRGVPPLARALQIARGIADVLVAAHENGIVHRDLKGDNVMILRADANAAPRIKLLDFGLAAALRDEPSTRLTTPGIVMGTPGYMAPEQGRGAPATPSLDVYGLGVVMFEMLSGALPFGDTDPMMVIVTKMTRPPPSLATRRADLPRELVRLVDECIALDPEKRPVDMASVRARLDAIATRELSPRPSVRVRGRVRPLAVRLAIGATLLVALRLVAPRVAHGEPALATPLPTVGDAMPLAALAIVPDEPRSRATTVAPERPAPIAAPAKREPMPARSLAIDTPACGRSRAQAQDARATHDWTGVLRHVGRRACWGSMVERERLRVLALLELHRFAECVATGERSRDPQVQRTVDLCRRRL